MEIKSSSNRWKQRLRYGIIREVEAFYLKRFLDRRACKRKWLQLNDTIFLTLCSVLIKSDKDHVGCSCFIFSNEFNYAEETHSTEDKDKDWGFVEISLNLSYKIEYCLLKQIGLNNWHFCTSIISAKWNPLKLLLLKFTKILFTSRWKSLSSVLLF